MGLYQWMGKLRGENRLAEIADNVASRSRDAVWQRVRGRLPTLGLNEARGYIRARSAMIIREEADHAIREERVVKPAQRAQLIETATDLVIRMMTSQQKAVQTQHVPLRRAA